MEALQFPDLQEVINTSNTLEEVWTGYISRLRSDASIINSLYANKLQELLTMLADDKLRELEQEFQVVKKQIVLLSQKHGVKICLSRRQKDFIGLNEKIRLYLMNNKPLSKLHDLLGFRITLCTRAKDDVHSVELCYEILNELVQYFVIDRGFLLMEAEPVLSTGLDMEKYPDIVIPQETLLPKEYEDNVKDYVRFPKQHGYQSLHTIIKKPDGLIFEIQIRTMAMDIRAEFGSASHKNHKLEKYEGVAIDLDLTKTNLQGFALLENGEVYDKIGLVKPIDPFNLL